MNSPSIRLYKTMNPLTGGSWWFPLRKTLPEAVVQTKGCWGNLYMIIHNKFMTKVSYGILWLCDDRRITAFLLVYIINRSTKCRCSLQASVHVSTFFPDNASRSGRVQPPGQRKYTYIRPFIRKFHESRNGAGSFKVSFRLRIIHLVTWWMFYTPLLLKCLNSSFKNIQSHSKHSEITLTKS